MAKTCMLLWDQSKRTKIIQGKDLDFTASIPAYYCDTYGIISGGVGIYAKGNLKYTISICNRMGPRANFLGKL